MIVGFRHKGLKRLFEKDDPSGIRPDLQEKVRTILSQLDEARTIEDMRMTSFTCILSRATCKAAGQSRSEPTGELFSALRRVTPTMLS